MNLPRRDLKLELNGSDVTSLHNDLTRLGLTIPPGERQSATFGPGTHDAVTSFQKDHGLATTGVVDTVTASAINQAVNAISYLVTGTVTSPDRAGVGGLRIQIVDKNVGKDVALSETTTDQQGHYQISFTAQSLQARHKDLPDLQARAFAGQTFLATSAVHYNATHSETLDISLPANATALPSELETLTSTLATYYSGSLRDLKESADQQDITYLANKTGWDARAVALASLADQFSQNDTHSQIPAAFYYALFRAGLPANEDTLYWLDPGTLTDIWKQAVTQGVISQALAVNIPQTVARFQTIGVQKRLAGPALTGISSLKDLLTTSQLNNAQQTQFAQLYAANQSDMPTFWKAVNDAFGKDVTKRLQIDGKLSFLTINNAPLMQALHKSAGASGIVDPVQLPQLGLYRADAWKGLLTANIPIPREIPGSGDEQRANYADYLAAQVRLSYPTAVVAQMVKSGDLSVGVPDQVHDFLTTQQGKFEIGMQPVQQYIALNNVQVDDLTLAQMKRLQRVYQMTPNDQAMSGLLKHGLDSAYTIVHYDRDAFVTTYQAELGGVNVAQQVYDKSVQIHNTVLNIAISYLTAKNGLPLGAFPLRPDQDGLRNAGLILQPRPIPPTTANAADVLAYPTLESLFGSMDYCTCDSCRSILSPAAYLVDLLYFLDKQQPEAGTENPLTVLLERRPDLQHLPLTCENTNTALPYIDVVNETLEYFIANNVQKLSLTGYTGHDTDGAASEDLLASPQFVMDAAYTILRGEHFPAPLPFHQPLENLRRYFNKFAVPLPLVMERLRKSDDLERGANAYGWRDIWMETLGISRAEHELLTKSNTIPLWQMYGFPDGTSDANVIAALSNAKQFCRRLGITYDDIVAILMTRFVNPNSDLLPKLERLGASPATLKALKDGTLTDASFAALLPAGAGVLDPALYGGDIKAWIKNEANFARITNLIMLIDPTASSQTCNFDVLEFRHVRPLAAASDVSTRLNAVEFIRLLRFIRLWKKTGWSIEQTDAALCALFKADLTEVQGEDINTAAKLDAGFLILLPRLGIVVHLMNTLNLTPECDLIPLLPTWSAIGTHGNGALYRQLFLNPALLKQDAVFADNGSGQFLTDTTKKLADHAEALRSALNLTGDEYAQITTALGYDANTALTLPNISAIYRRGYLARKLRLSVRELLLLISLTGLDPFAAPDPVQPTILRLIDFVQTLRDRSLNSAAALYLIWNQDLSGKSAPDPAQIIDLARTLRGDYASIEDQFAATEDPGGDIARARMTLVYGQETSDAFFALLDNTLMLDVSYTHPAAMLEAAITAVDNQLAYDDFRHRLSHTGVLNDTTRKALKQVAAVTTTFQQAVDALFAQSEDAKGSFFTRYPELKPLYDAYIASPKPLEQKRSDLLAAFRPGLSRQRKRQQALQRLSATAGVDLTFTQALMDPAQTAGVPYPLHATAHTNQPAVDDILALETPGLATQIFYRATATGSADPNIPSISANVDYSPMSSNPLPANPVAGNTISGIWRGLIEAPDAGFYNIVIEADAGVQVTLMLGGQIRALTQNGMLWRNSDPLELKAATLYEIVLTVENVKNTLSLKWETPKRPREVIPGRYLYSPALLPVFSDTYTRFLKGAALAVSLNLTTHEIAYFATSADYQISGDGWLNALPTRGDPDPVTAAALLKPFLGLLDFARIKAGISPGDEQLLAAITDPQMATASTNSLLYTLTRWDSPSLTALLSQFGRTIADLSHLDLFSRIYDAFTLLQTIGIAASALLQATTNEPTGDIVRNLQATLRARYAVADWRSVVQPINDEMRDLQRDALVAYILHQMRSNPATSHIDTTDKLFEYFLMDVLIEPCMQTSRIRHALSSVQLFTERCLMNLEPRVAASSIDAQQWQWRKRYRVWEANRKVFLWPENWLEPELRDDQSSFFKETMSELLQSDITDDAAASALLNYLSKLEEVAKLEPCGICYVENTPGNADDVTHVVARTAGAHRKYYYRRREFGYWTPWEQMKLDIEDNPVLPVVWKDRLLFFWLRILKQSPLDSQSQTSSNTNNLASISLDDVRQDAQANASSLYVHVQAVLCWSEYYNGKWQPAKTSDINLPTALTSYLSTDPNGFNRSYLRLLASEEDDLLRIYIQRAGYSSFLLYNTHSLPVRQEDAPPPLSYFVRWRDFQKAGSNLNILYEQGSASGPAVMNRHVLNSQTGLPFTTLEPLQASSRVFHNLWDDPFFFQDSQHIFYVSTSETPVLIPIFSGYSISQEPLKLQITIPHLVTQPNPIIDKVGPISIDLRSGLGVNGAVTSFHPGIIVNPSTVGRFVSEDANIRTALASGTTVRFGTSEIGLSGRVMNIRLSQGQ